MNMDLSQRRADSVKRYLEEHGVDSSCMEAAGFGETQPIATNDTIPEEPPIDASSSKWSSVQTTSALIMSIQSHQRTGGFFDSVTSAKMHI